jgi:hypothetical protein
MLNCAICLINSTSHNAACPFSGRYGAQKAGGRAMRSFKNTKFGSVAADPVWLKRRASLPAPAFALITAEHTESLSSAAQSIANRTRLGLSAKPFFFLFSNLKSPKRSAGGILDSTWIRIQRPKPRFLNALRSIRRTDWEGLYDRLGGGDATPWEGRYDSSGAPYCDRLGGVCG